MFAIGLPHIGIEADGTIGVTVRRGQMSPTATCGALASIFDLAQAGQLPTEIDFDDFEATRLAIRLVDRLLPWLFLVISRSRPSTHSRSISGGRSTRRRCGATTT